MPLKLLSFVIFHNTRKYIEFEKRNNATDWRAVDGSLDSFRSVIFTLASVTLTNVIGLGIIFESFVAFCV